MYDRLQAVEDRYDELNELLSDPNVVSDAKKLRDYSKEQSAITETVETYREYKEVTTGLAETREMMNEKLDDDMKEMVKEEFNELTAEKKPIRGALKTIARSKRPE